MCREDRLREELFWKAASSGVRPGLAGFTFCFAHPAIARFHKLKLPGRSPVHKELYDREGVAFGCGEINPSKPFRLRAPRAEARVEAGVNQPLKQLVRSESERALGAETRSCVS